MSLFVRTGIGGSNPAVKINDLGTTIQPGSSFVELTKGSSGNPNIGSGQFTIYELYKSIDLFTLINNGTLEASSNGTAHDILMGSYTTGYSISSANRIDPATAIPQYITVGQGGNVNFTSIKAAIDSITDSSLAKIYTVFVYPGVYVEDTIIMKTGINLVGIGNLVAIIAPSNPANTIIVGADVSSIYGVILSGAEGFGSSSITYTSSSINHSNTFLIQHCFFATNDTHISIVGGSPGTFTNVEMVECRFGGLLSNFKTGINISAPTSGNALLGMSGTNMFSSDASIPDNFLLADGYGTFVSMSGCDISTKQIGPSSGTAIQIRNGADFSASSLLLSGWNKALWMENVGAASTLKVGSGNLFNNTMDLTIEHPNGLGSFSGVLTFSKVNIDTSSAFALSGDDLSTGSVIILNELIFGKSVSSATDVGDLILSSPTLGVSSGGALSKGVGFTVNIAFGFGYVQIAPFPNTQLKKIVWPNSSITLSANSANYLFFNSIGILTAAASSPDTTQNIILGRAVTHGTGIDFIDPSELNANHSSNLLDQTIRSILGATYVSGSIVTDAGSRRLNVSNGAYYLAQNLYTPSGGSPISLTNYYQNGSGGTSRQFGQTQINNTQYDDGSGTLATLTDGYYTKHSLYVVGDGYVENYMVVFGQAQYQSNIQAESAMLPVPPVFFSDGVALLASVVILKNASSFDQIKDERNIRGNSPTALAAAADHGNLLGLLDDDHPQYLLTDGIRPMGGNIDMGGFSVVDVNLVDSVKVSSHASRHLPNGADPLTTAIPVNIGTGNTIGTANSLARSDHGHSHSNLPGGSLHAQATGSVDGFLAAADKAKLDILTQETTILTVRNESGSTITKGRLVASVGYDVGLNVVTVNYADKDTESLRPAIGVTRQDIPNNTTDVVLVTGILSGVDTSSYSLTQQLALGNDGYFSVPPPDIANFTGEVQLVGSTVKTGITDGQIIFDVGQGLNPVTAAQVYALIGTDGYASSINPYVTNSDPRNTNSRNPTGTAGGQLSGTYPNPSVIALTETSGPTALTIGAIRDGYGVVRVGSTFVGRQFGQVVGTFADGYDNRFPAVGEKQALAGTSQLPSSSNKYVTETDSRLTNARTTTGTAGGQLSGTYPNPSVIALTETSGPTALTYGAIPDGYGLSRSGSTVTGKAFGQTSGTFADGYDNRFPAVGEKQALAGTSQLPSSSNKYVTETDSRLTNSRTPSGAATGQLSGIYPGPAVIALTETSGPTALTIGSIIDGYVLTRSTTHLVSSYLPPLATITSPSLSNKSPSVIGTDQTSAHADHKHDISTASPSIGIGAGSSEGTATTIARSDHNHAIRETGGPTDLTVGSITDGYLVKRSGTNIVGTQFALPLQTFTVTAAGDITTVSTSDVLATNMTITPGAGTYICWFSTDVQQSVNNVDLFISIYVNGSKVTNSERHYHDSNANQRDVVSITMLLSGVGAGQAVEARWRVAANTGTMGNRSLTLLQTA